MKFSEIFETALLTEAPIHSISPQEAIDRGMFGPVYHGTRHDIEEILKTGFDTNRSIPSDVNRFGRVVGTSNGYSMDNLLGAGVPPPIHHLGFGTYFTTVKAIAKQFNGDTVKGLKTFYIDSKNIDEINFGSNNTMMRWWHKNGYNLTPENNKNFQAWIKATKNLTNTLSSQFDAVWFKGKGFAGRLLDGDQVCVYRPELIYVVDPKKATGLEIGAKVTHTGFIKQYKRNDLYVDNMRSTDFGSAGKLGPTWKGIFRAIDHDGKDIPREGGMNGHGNLPIHYIPPSNIVGTIIAKRPANSHWPETFDVKWSKGGAMYNYTADELKPYVK